MIDPRIIMFLPSGILALFMTLAVARPIHIIVDALVLLTGGALP